MSFVTKCIETALDPNTTSKNYSKKLEEGLKDPEHWYAEHYHKLHQVETEDLKELDSQRNYFDIDHVVLKINRFGHSMDPERGMAKYYNLCTENSSLRPQKLRMWVSEDKDTWYHK